MVGVLALLGGVATTIARAVPGGVGGDTFAMITTFTDFGLLAYVVAAVLLGAALVVRFRLPTLAVLVAALLLGGYHASWILPRFVGESGGAGQARFTVVAQNLFLGDADPVAVLANARDADVLVVVEATQRSTAGMIRAGVERRFPYAAGGPMPARGASGTRIFSRYPITESRPLNPRAADLPVTDGNSNWLARIDVPGLGPVNVVAAHPVRPHYGGTRWWPEQERLMTALPREQTVVAGDFNAVSSHPSLRWLLGQGFRGADDIVGAGWDPTFPALDRIPPVITIDHVLVSADLTATAFRTVDIPGSDHRGVAATIARRA